MAAKTAKREREREREDFKNKSMCVLLLKLSVLNVCGISIEAGDRRKRVDLRMNALLEPNFLHPRKTMNCL